MSIEQTQSNQTQPNQANSLESVVGSQRETFQKALNDVYRYSNTVIDNWVNNYVTVDIIKNRRTEQLNYVLGMINQLANEGMIPLVQLGNDLKDPDVSNKVLECNNALMIAARQVLENIQKSEEALKKEMEDRAQSIQKAQQGNSVPTEVKAQEV